MATGTFRVKKAYTGNTKLIPVAPGNILRSYEVKRLVCARNWTLFTITKDHSFSSIEEKSNLHISELTANVYFWMHCSSKTGQLCFLACNPQLCPLHPSDFSHILRSFLQGVYAGVDFNSPACTIHLNWFSIIPQGRIDSTALSRVGSSWTHVGLL